MPATAKGAKNDICLFDNGIWLAVCAHRYPVWYFVVGILCDSGLGGLVKINPFSRWRKGCSTKVCILLQISGGHIAKKGKGLC